MALVLLAAGCSHSSQSAPSPTQPVVPITLEDHWHVPMGFNICGEFISHTDSVTAHPPTLDSPFDFENGILHVSPTPDVSNEEDFTLGNVASKIGIHLTDDSFSFLTRNSRGQLSFDGATTYVESVGCNGEPSVLSISRWQLQGTDPLQPLLPEIFTENLASIALTSNLEAYTISLLPLGTPQPPIPLSALELLRLPEISQRTDIPTPEELGLIPNRVSPPPAGETLSGNFIPCPAEDNTRRITQFPNVFVLPPCIDISKTYTAIFRTNVGNVEVELDNSTINATNAFVLLALYNYYDGSALFRTDPRQGIIQGGAVHNNQVDDPGPGFLIRDDSGNFNYESGQLIMARNQSANSGNGQFILTANSNAVRLGASETTHNLIVFGRIVEGLSILRRILSLHAEDPLASAETQLFLGGPILPVVIQTIDIVETANIVEQ